jgi:hypothetical protein
MQVYEKNVGNLHFLAKFCQVELGMLDDFDKLI